MRGMDGPEPALNPPGDRLAPDALALGEMLARREQFYRCVLESLSEGVILTDVESRILFANRRMEEISGWRPDELIGRTSHEVLLPPAEWPSMRKRLEERLMGREETYEHQILRKDGSRHWVLVRASPYRGAEGRVMGTIGAMSCIHRQKQLEVENERLLDVLAVEREFPGIVGSSPALAKVMEQVRLVAGTEANVLILGESGSGKELVARAIHDASARRTRPLVRVNCASVPAELFESEFFGHVRGAFTGAVRDRAGRFESAEGGTLFLDEVGEIPVGLQAKLLRVLQEGTFERVGEDRTRKVNVRIVAATNRDLAQEVRSGRFRADLYYRLSVFPIELPPLRDRREDVRPLATHFLSVVGGRMGRSGLSIPPTEWQRLESYSWPGNVRELQNVVERAVILAGAGASEVRFNGLLPQGDPGAHALSPASLAGAGRAGAGTAGVTLGALREHERAVIREVLNATGGRVYGAGGAAERLGMKPTTLMSRLRRWGWR